MKNSKINTNNDCPIKEKCELGSSITCDKFWECIKEALKNGENDD